MVGDTHHELNEIKYEREWKEWGERSYGEVCLNLNMSLTHFDHFLPRLSNLWDENEAERKCTDLPNGSQRVIKGQTTKGPT